MTSQRENGMLHYLGPTVGRVPLSSWHEVEAAAQGGLLEETQWVELKEMPSPSNKATNTELGKDLASMSVHGGVLIFGVRDKTFDVVGCDVSGLVDRISQVASLRVHPPLSPIIYPAVSHPDDPEKAVLVVEVPPSQQAPHMVDDSYWGRSSNGKRKLSDAEVRGLLQNRASTETAFKERLLDMVDDDPLARLVVGHPTGNGHLYLLAEPCAPVLGRDPDFDLAPVVHNEISVSGRGPVIGRLTNRGADPLGQTMEFPAPHQDPVERRHEDHASHLLCRDGDSSLEYVSGGGTYFREGGPSREESMEIVGVGLIVIAVREFLCLIERLSSGHWGYSGQWRVGIHITHLAGKHVSFDDLMTRHVTFPRETYTQHIVTSPTTLAEKPDKEAKRLLAGFLRAIGCATWELEQVVSRY